ncbi:MAG: hypothetical protein A2293_11080 [Elusimicrobia bacterium RIFOXYB2_FULL_49_7]|nr:MAG: hypothetical protein A2293_11080 [Elusimicrobia bacterium RIFOXYB2_FULL_49_7]
MRFFIVVLLSVLSGFSQTVINHSCRALTQIPLAWIDSAKTKLHIAYGHTSHGSQLTTGMTGLVGFINGNGLGLDYSENVFAWNTGGTNGALDLRDGAMAGDVGYYPQWVENTTAYLGTPNSSGRGSSHPDVNVIIWSWCGQVSTKYADETLASEYLVPMDSLENLYPGIVFVYMTGHLNHWADSDTKGGNQMIRDYCNTNQKVLYDFADIESYDPDGNFYEFASDDCSYYAGSSGSYIGNWAQTWQNSHTEEVDWYTCSSAHSEPLNANLKAYAAWWLWATLAGWDGATAIDKTDEAKKDLSTLSLHFSPNPFNPKVKIMVCGKLETGSILEIYEMAGKRIQTMTLSEHSLSADRSLVWNGANHPSGLYLVRIISGNKAASKQMTLLK